MTEAEWLESDNLELMVSSFLDRSDDRGVFCQSTIVSDRKLRSFVCLCVRQVWSQLDSISKKAIEFAEQYANVDCAQKLLGHWRGAVHQNYRKNLRSLLCYLPCLACSTGMATLLMTIVEWAEPDVDRSLWPDILRDTISNPGKTQPRLVCQTCSGRGGMYGGGGGILTSGGWLTCTECEGFGTTTEGRFINKKIHAMATGIYEEANEDGTISDDHLKVLSDAMEENGCPTEIVEPCSVCKGAGTTEDGIGCDQPCFKCSPGGKWAGTGKQTVLNPLLVALRSPGPHWYGFWALDLLRGKE